MNMTKTTNEAKVQKIVTCFKYNSSYTLKETEFQ